VVQERFQALFSAEELREAHRRLKALPVSAFPSRQDLEDLHPAEVASDREYTEGAVRQVTVNEYERNRAARAACIRHHGARCIVCALGFEDRYGEIGKGFIHVHHLRPMALNAKTYKLNPRKDLVPVCPNCHAMLHSQSPPLDPEDLKSTLRSSNPL
jgi:5-methylcytosine-specific restriction enzyme A